MKFAFYGRVSTQDRQDPHLSLPSQKAACKRKVAELGGQIVAEFTDVDSARKESREGLMSLLEAASQPDRPFDAVIVWRTSRLARETFFALQVERWLNDMGISLYVADEPGDPKSPATVLQRRIKMAIDEFYILELKQEVMRGMKENALQGYHNGGEPPFGYRLKRLPHPHKRGATRSTYEVNPKEAEVVRLIFKLFVEGYSYGAIVKRLNQEGLRTRRGKKWSKNTIYSMVRNPKYAGYTVWGRYTYRTLGNRKKKARNPNEWILRPNTIPAIIDLTTWHKAQERIQTLSKGKTISEGRFLLAGKIFCECGGKMHGQAVKRKKKRTNYYRCAKCRGYVRADWAEEKVHRGIMTYLTSEKGLKELEKAVLKAIERIKQRGTKKEERLLKKLSKLKNKERKLISLVEDGVEVATERFRELQNERKAIEAELFNIRAQRRGSAKEMRDIVTDALEEVRKNRLKSEKIFEFFVEKVTYEKARKRLKIDLKLGANVGLRLVAGDHYLRISLRSISISAVGT